MHAILSSGFPPKLAPSHAPSLLPSLHVSFYCSLLTSSSSLSSSLHVCTSRCLSAARSVKTVNVGKFSLSQAGFTRFHQWMEYIPQSAQWLLEKWVGIYLWKVLHLQVASSVEKKKQQQANKKHYIVTKLQDKSVKREKQWKMMMQTVRRACKQGGLN